MIGNNKRISPAAIMALKEALSVVFWKKEDLLDFLKLTIDNKGVLGSIDWNGRKRDAVKELVDRMTGNPSVFNTDLMNILLSVSDMTEFPQLKYWDEDGTKTKRAKEAVNSLRSLTKGYNELSKEEDEARKRKIENEKKLIISKSLAFDLGLLRERFNQLAILRDLQKRGYALETFLYDLLLLYELEPKGSFKNYGEQIDGAFTFQGNDYLLEAKWKRQVDRSELASFCYKVETKFKTAVGLMVTIDGVTPEAISPDFKSIIIMDAQDIIAVLDDRISFTDLLFKKRRKAIETGKIYLSFDQLI